MADSNVVEFSGVTKLPIDPDRVLQKAVGEVDSAVVVGWTNDGELYFASSEPSGPEVLWLLEVAKRKILEIGTNND